MKIYIDGELFVGAPIEITEKLREGAFEEFDSLDAYIIFTCHNVWKAKGVAIQPPSGETLEERAESFIRQLMDKDLVVDGEALI